MQVATFEIKSANLPLVALLLKSSDIAQLGDELHGRFGELPDFFDNDPLVIDLTPLGGGEVDLPAVVELLRKYKVRPVAVKGGSEGMMRRALEAGLAPANDAREWMPDQVRHDNNGPRHDNNGPQHDKKGPPADKSTEAPPAIPTTALVIDKPLRSGQQVYARGRDVVVMAMVNAGAEVIADGHIHVYAPLRGKAMAGARGNADARILTLCLEPELVSIAGVYRTSEVPLPADLKGGPAQIRLQGGADKGKLVIEALNT